jgi:hypothetical protein
VPELAQADFMRGIRGEKVVPGQTPKIQPVLGGISSISRTAIRRVHQESPDSARVYFEGAIAKFVLMGDRAAATCDTYRRSVNRYIEWDGGSGDADIDLKLVVPFGPEDRVRAIAHVAREVGEDAWEGRVLLWDDLPLGSTAAEIIALPIVECVENVHGVDSVVAVDVWHLARREKERVERNAALARRPDVESFFADL